jgi:peptidoglycan/xylan/chitin deacetylase (PgdA/CDA1 family)
LDTAGFRTLPLAETLQPTPSDPLRIGITFDDGFRNVLRFGVTPLAQHRFHAIEFLVADLIGKGNEWEQREGEAPEALMDVAEIREWLAAGHGIGSHSLTHPYLTRISRVRAREEVTASRKQLQDLFGLPIDHFCYPYGDWNEAVRDLVQDAGYKTACTTDFGVNTSATSWLCLKRITARYPSRNLKALWAWLSAKFNNLARGL